MNLTPRQYRELYEGIMRDPSLRRRALALENLVTSLEIAYDIRSIKETGWMPEDLPVRDLYEEVKASLERSRRQLLDGEV